MIDINMGDNRQSHDRRTTPSENLLEVQGLKAHFNTEEGVVKAVDGVNYMVRRGKTLGVVGESGSGKSIGARSLMQLLDRPGRIVAGEIKFNRDDGSVVDIAKLTPRGEEIRKIRAAEIAMIFQEPMSSLSPVHTINDQIGEIVRLHWGYSKKQARERVLELLEQVEMPKPKTVLDSYTFELSGGMRQRAMIAMGLACNPSLLIADEPTTALDVTTQAVVLDLIRNLQKTTGMSVMFITHDLGVIAELADDVVVMYLGTVVESGSVYEIFQDPKHPYTRSLLESIPRLGPEKKHRLTAIRGMVPHPLNRPTGCPFHNRCPEFMPGRCDKIVPPVEHVGVKREVRCLLYSDTEIADNPNT
ncbi:ABC transporter ATP-binding protein [Roseinatronobacter sp. S2]|uniref:ABC transporter ATP-binding protein n=1 Tax=Roseinatronobacter sp. S2 TaxID=3035471 RepID=UPI00240F5FBB|nr:ABC transporter ATP-binding protein [Roseinatronobacter sp. S2]WFE73361.1 ABC transporter ATP-binding protein [Roseinatronobacter sp. S2]